MAPRSFSTRVDRNTVSYPMKWGIGKVVDVWACDLQGIFTEFRVQGRRGVFKLPRLAVSTFSRLNESDMI